MVGFWESPSTDGRVTFPNTRADETRDAVAPATWYLATALTHWGSGMIGLRRIGAGGATDAARNWSP